MTKQNETLSYCGIYCGSCKNYKQNMNCMGCRYEESMVDDCPTRACAIKRGLVHCGECSEFPCAILKDFYEDGVCLHKQAFENMQLIKDIGVETWLTEQEKK